ncbi:hypothetical protein V5O48_001957 [Marasmius crinis-equi]|uniref:TERF2-interacting telomeric protein 1 Myb domain-containing protein n=1 Tax=Marasmius crinis-equi TaxID=585013 RepID=A0ABR3FWW4_9AGAR
MESYPLPSPYRLAHIAEQSRSRPPSKKLSEVDDMLLVSWLAKNNPDGSGRRGHQTYERLVEEHPIGTGISSGTWRERYLRNREYFDPLIRQYLIDNTEAEGTSGSSSNIPPEIQPFTDEDETLLVEYLANNADPDGKGLLGRLVYQNFSANEGGNWPGGAKHSWYTWRDHYRSNADKLNKLIEESRLANNISTASLKMASANRKSALAKRKTAPSKSQIISEDPEQSSSALESNQPDLHSLFADFIAEMKAEGVTAFGGLAVYQRLVNNEEGKWPWGKLRTVHGWKFRYRDQKAILDPLIEARLAKISSKTMTAPPADGLTPLNIVVDRDYASNANSPPESPDIERDASTLEPEDLEPPSTSSPLTSLLSGREASETESLSSPQVESSAGLSFSRYSETRPESNDPLSQGAAAVISQIPTYGLFTPQDDTVLLKYMVERSIQAKPGKKKRLGDIFEAIDVFQDLTKTVPAAGRHTAQAWRTRYMKHKLQFDRLVNQLKGPVERARRQAPSYDSISDISYGIKRPIGDDDTIKRPKKIKKSAKNRKAKQIEAGEDYSIQTSPIQGLEANKSDSEEEQEVAGYLCSMIEG